MAVVGKSVSTSRRSVLQAVGASAVMVIVLLCLARGLAHAQELQADETNKNPTNNLSSTPYPHNGPEGSPPSSANGILTAPNHFIVVIDTSGDMGNWLHRDGITAHAVAKALFEGWGEHNHTPIFKPGAGDQLSLISFDLRRGNNNCPGPEQYDLSTLDNLFKWHPIQPQSYQNEEQLSRYLRA